MNAIHVKSASVARALELALRFQPDGGAAKVRAHCREGVEAVQITNDPNSPSLEFFMNRSAGRGRILLRKARFELSFGLEKVIGEKKADEHRHRSGTGAREQDPSGSETS